MFDRPSRYGVFLKGLHKLGEKGRFMEDNKRKNRGVTTPLPRVTFSLLGLSLLLS